MRVHQLESIYVWLAGAMLLMFSGAILISVYGLDMGVPGSADSATGQVAAIPGFNEPGSREVSPGRYEVYMIVESYQFTPNEVTFPAGSQVTFFLASTDVTHSFKVFNTPINISVIPGYISEVTYTFAEPGEYMFICGEYCGVEHHLMNGVIIVENADGQ